ARILQPPPRPVIIYQAPAFMLPWIWPVMWGSGWRTGLGGLITVILLPATQLVQQRAITGCIAAAPGTAMDGTCASPTAAGLLPVSATTISVSAAPWGQARI